MTDNTIMVLDEGVIKDMVYEIRGQKVMLDFGLARIYGYETKRLNEQVNRNIDRFPPEFMFQLTHEEALGFLKSQNVISMTGLSLFSHRGGSRYLPYAFTEQGIYMLMQLRLLPKSRLRSGHYCPLSNSCSLTKFIVVFVRSQIATSRISSRFFGQKQATWRHFK